MRVSETRTNTDESGTREERGSQMDWDWTSFFVGCVVGAVAVWQFRKRYGLTSGREAGTHRRTRREFPKDAEEAAAVRERKKSERDLHPELGIFSGILDGMGLEYKNLIGLPLDEAISQGRKMLENAGYAVVDRAIENRWQKFEEATGEGPDSEFYGRRLQTVRDTLEERKETWEEEEKTARKKLQKQIEGEEETGGILDELQEGLENRPTFVQHAWADLVVANAELKRVQDYYKRIEKMVAEREE